MESEPLKNLSWDSEPEKYLVPAFRNHSTVLILLAIVGSLYKWKVKGKGGSGSGGSRSRASYINEFPGPKTLPLIGNGHQMLFKPTEFYSWTANLSKNWGGIVRLWRLNFPMFFVSSFETASFLLSKRNFNAKTQDLDLFWRIPGGNGISASPAHLHHSRRKLLNPGFSKKVVERSIYVFCEESRKLVENLGGYAKTGETFEALGLLMTCAFRIISRSAIGDELMAGTEDSKALEQMHALHTIAVNFTNRILSPFMWLRNDFIYFNLTPEGRRTRREIKVINDFGQEAINRHRRQRMEKSKSNVETQPCYLSMLLDLQESGDIQEGDLLGELNNYVVGGYDAPALAVAWTLFALATEARHHQDKIYEEVNEILGGFEPGHEITAAETNKMKYLDLCIKEALRMYPATPVFPRSTAADMHLPDGRVIPAKSDVMIMINLIHRDPKWFPQPDQFIPERHLEHNPAFLPFSSGVRNCIGQSYGMHMIKLQLAYLFKDFIWETDERAETIPRLFQVMMVPANGIHFRISKRCNENENGLKVN